MWGAGPDVGLLVQAHPFDVKHRLTRGLAVLVVALVMAACGASVDTGTGGATTSRPTTTISEPAFRTCTAEVDGYRLEYPGSWHTNDPETTEPCRFFHPEPFQATPATEATDVAVVIRFTSAAHDSIVESTVESPAGAVILTDERLSVAGSRAARVTTRATGEGLLAEGIRSVRWFVDFDTRTMTATTLSVVEDFEANAQVLDHMMRGLVRVEPPGRAPTCSASGMEAEVTDQPEVPAPVRDMRRRIVDAAVACDFERLAALALSGSRPFTYSFGGGGEPADYWRRQEEGPGPHPLRYLVGVLDRPHRRLEPHHDLSARYVWPSAFGYETWEAVPRDAKEALKPLYTQENFENFLRFGGYTGYRVGIALDGEWLFFVAGD